MPAEPEYSPSKKPAEPESASSFEKLVQSRITGLTEGLVEDCERLALEREEQLREQCKNLQEEVSILKSKLGEASNPDNGGTTAGGAEPTQVVVEDQGGSGVDPSAKFEPLPELLTDALAGNVALEEDYWTKNAARPDHNQAFFDTGSTFHEVDLVAAMQGCVVNPSSHVKLAWDIIGIPVLAWDLITIPMQVFEIGETPLMMTMGWVTLIYWTMDMPFTFMTGIYNDEGDLIMSLRIISCNYLRGCFFLDFIIIGADWAGIFINMLGDSAPGALKNMSILRALRISRFLRLMRLKKLKAKWQTIEDHIESEWVLVCLNLCSKIAMIMALNHYIGCVFYWMGTMEIPGYETWLHHHPYPQFGSKENKLSRAPWGYLYITSVHWAITQFTPGSMHVQAQNIPERIFSIFCLLFGLVVFSSFIASVTQARMQLNKMMSKFERDLWLLRKYCRQHNVSHGLTVRMKRYVDLVIVPKFQNMSDKDVVLLPQLSLHLRDELATELASQHLHLHPFFKELIKNKAVMTKVCVASIQNVDYARGDVVFNAGQVAHQMYVLARGVLEYIPHSKGHEMNHLEQGSFVCEAVLWTQWTNQGQLQVSVECTCMIIDAAKFRSAIRGNSLVMAFARRYAYAFLDGMNKELQKGEMPSDVQMNYTKEVNVDALKKKGKRAEPTETAPPGPAMLKDVEPDAIGKPGNATGEASFVTPIVVEKGSIEDPPDKKQAI